MSASPTTVSGRRAETSRLRLPRLSFILATGVTGLSLVLGLATTPAVGNDPTQGILAALQVIHGKSARIDEIRAFAPPDLVNPQEHRITWWPPAYQLGPYLAMKAGLGLGIALRLTLLVCWAVGASGWWLFCFAVSRSKGIAETLVFLILSHRAAHSHFFGYVGGDLHVWAAMPWLLLLVCFALRTPDTTRGAVSIAIAGLGLALLPGLRYAAAFLSLGVTSSLAWQAISDVNRRRLVVPFAAGVATGSLALLRSGFLDLVVSATPGSSASVENSTSLVLLFAFSGPILGLTGFDLSIAHALPAVSSQAQTMLAIMCSAVLVCIAVALVSTQSSVCRSEKNEVGAYLQRLALSVWMASALGIAVTMLRGGAVSYEGRHFWLSGLLLLPAGIPWMLDEARFSKPRRRWVSGFVLLSLVALPTGHGLLSFLEKALIRQRREANLVTPSGIRNQAFREAETAETLIRSVRGRLEPTDLLVVWGHSAAIEFSDRDLVIMPDGSRGSAEVRFPRRLGRAIRMLVPGDVAFDDEAMARLRDWFQGPVDRMQEVPPGAGRFRFVTVRER